MVDKMIKMNICQRSRLKLLLSALFIAFLSMSGITLAQQTQLQDMQVLADTLFRNMSIDELKKIQQEYQDRVQTITGEEEKMREMGLEVTETLLRQEGERIKDQDKILVRMAEYYIEKAENEYFAKQEVYDKEYTVYLEKLDQFTAGKPLDPRGLIQRQLQRELAAVDCDLPRLWRDRRPIARTARPRKHQRRKQPHQRCRYQLGRLQLLFQNPLPLGEGRVRVS